jgi:hypothetical protein
LVDQEDDAIIFAKGGSEPARRRRDRGGPIVDVAQQAGRGGWIEDRAGGLRRGSLQGLRGSSHGGSRLEQLAGKRPEEATPAQVHTWLRRRSTGRSGFGWRLGRPVGFAGWLSQSGDLWSRGVST